MNQILFGALIPFLVAVAIYIRRGARASFTFLVLTPVWMALGALYAVVPDLPRLFGRPDVYHRWSHDPRMNIFLWHYAIDRVEVDSSFYHAGLIVMLLLLLGAAWRELYLVEKT